MFDSLINFLFPLDPRTAQIEAARQGEHIDEVWNVGRNGAKAYHVANPKDGKEWTTDRNKAPHQGHGNFPEKDQGVLTEYTPTTAYQNCQNFYLEDDPTGESLVDQFNRAEDDATQRAYESYYGTE